MDRFSRMEMLVGREGLDKLAQSKVAVFGIGGVGAAAVEGLARAGVGALVLVDSDCIEPTNINRQIHAATSTLGRPKVEVMRERVLDINPAAVVTAWQRLYRPEIAADLLADDYDYVVDAIDMVTEKIDLVVRCAAKNIPIISAMGAGNKLDPARLEVADIKDTSVCPLARVMRQELRRRGIHSLKVVYSREKPLTPQMPPEEDGGTGWTGESASRAGDFLAGQRPRRSTPGSISFVPITAGMLIAGEVVRDLLRRKK